MTTSLYYNPYSNPYSTFGLNRAQSTQWNHGVRTTSIPAAQPESPVNPVQPVPPVSQVQDTDTPLDTANLLRQMENDPAAMAVRNRILPSDIPNAQNAQNIPGVPNIPNAQNAQNAQDPQNVGNIGDGPDSEATGPESVQKTVEEGECQTCKERKYQDGSDDPGVSFKTASHIDPDQAAAAVRGHEQEHVVREQAKAVREDREVVSQSVSIHTAICPECGRTYISGGTTRTVTRANSDPQPEAETDKTQGAQGKETK